jgi:hypothetical protein
MTAVVKTASMQELRDILANAEGLERYNFDPQTGVGRFVIKPETVEVTDPQTGTVTTRERNRIRFAYNDRDFGLNGDAYLRLGQMLGIPGAYIKKTPHALMVPHMNHWLQNGAVDHVGFAVSDNIIRLFSKGAVTPVSNYQVLDTLEEVAGRNLEAAHISTNLFGTSFSVVTDRQAPIAKGDIVQTGVRIDNSYAGTSPLTIATYVHRLVCTNGAISVSDVHRYSRRNDDTTPEWIRAALNEALEAADAEVERVKALRDIKFDGHMSDAMNSIFAEFGVPSALRTQVTNRTIDQGVDNLQDLYNIITDLASNDEAVLADASMSSRLMRVGGHIAANPEYCGECHRVLR